MELRDNLRKSNRQILNSVIFLVVAVLIIPAFAIPVNDPFLSVDLNDDGSPTQTGWDGWDITDAEAATGVPIVQTFGSVTVTMTPIGYDSGSNGEGANMVYTAGQPDGDEELQDFLRVERNTGIGLGQHMIVLQFSGLNPNAQYEATMLCFDQANNGNETSYMAFDTRNPADYTYNNGWDNYWPAVGGVNANYAPDVNSSTNPFYGDLLGRVLMSGSWPYDKPGRAYYYSDSGFALADANGEMTLYLWNDSDEWGANLISILDAFELGEPNYTWNGSSSNVWTSGDNWLGGAAPIDGVSVYDTLVFGPNDTGDRTITGADIDIDKIEGISFAGAAGAYSITGTGTFDIDAGGSITGDGGYEHTLNVGLVTNSGGGINFEGDDDYIVGGVVSGAGDVNVADDVKLTLNGTNTYTGDTTMNTGSTIVLGSSSALGIGGGLTLAGDATLQSNSDTVSVSNTIDNGGNTLTVSGTNNLGLTGVISGAGDISKSGTSVLTLGGNNTFTGGVTLGGGTIILGHNNALGTAGLTLGGAGALQSNNDSRSVSNDIDNGGNALTVSGAYDLELSGIISGTGALTKSGTSTLLLSGVNTYTGATTVSAGTLNLSGSLASAVTVGDGGTIMGTGTFGSNVTLNSGGSFAPGASIGTTYITGNYLQNSGSTLEVEIAKALDDSLSSDLLDVTGSATLASGSIVNVTDVSPSTEHYVDTGDEFTIITADGGVTDSGASITSTSAVLSFTGAVVGDDYILTTTRSAFEEFAVGANNKALLGAIQDDMAGASGDYLGLINTLSGLSAPALNNAAEQLSPMSHSSLGTFNTAMLGDLGSDLNSYLVARRSNKEYMAQAQYGSLGNSDLLLADASENPDTMAYVITETERREQLSKGTKKTNMFFRPFGVFFSQDSTPQFVGFNAKSVGAQFGADQIYGTNWIIGIAGSYSHSYLDFDSGFGEADIDSFRVGPYATYYKDKFYVDTSVSLGYHLNKTTREVGVAGDAAEADYDAYDMSAYVGGGYEFNFGKWIFSPTVSARYTYYRHESFKESGANGAGLEVDAQSQQSLVSRLGIRLYTVTMVDTMKLAPEIFVGYSHEFVDDEDIQARFLGGTTKFSTNVDSGRDDSVYYGAGLSGLLNEKTTAFVRYEGEAYSGTRSTALKIGLTYRF
ncbi:MAG: autotransporter domain-containing protein [Phycisphaerae bacterium]